MLGYLIQIKIMFTEVQLLITISAVAWLPNFISCSTGEISIAPSNRVKPDTEVTLTCSVDRIQNQGTEILWWKNTGDVDIKLGINSGINQEFSSRYSLRQSSDGNVDTFTLTIKDAKDEDSGTYICQRSYRGTDGALTSTVLAVCANTDSQSCKCMENEGYLKSTCFEQPEDAQKVIDRYKNAVIGVVVCLIIAIVYGVIVSIMLSRDCLQRMKVKAKKKLEDMQLKQTAIPGDDASTRHLNDSDEASYYNASPHSHSSVYNVPHRSHEQEDREHSYMAIVHQQQQHPHHQRIQQEHVKGALDGNENLYGRSMASAGHPDGDYHNSGLSDSSSSSWGNGARPKNRHLKPPEYSDNIQGQPSPKMTSETARNAHDQSGSRSPRLPSSESSRMAYPDHQSTGTSNRHQPEQIQNTPTTVSRSTGHSDNNQESAGGRNVSGPRTPTDVPYGQKRQAPLYPGQGGKQADGRKAKQYDTYENGLQNISQQTPSYPTPQSTHSEQIPYSPKDNVELNSRAAYTDVPQARAGGDNLRNGHMGARQHYTQPRKLDYVNGSVVNSGQTNAAYVSETDTMI